MEESNDEPQCGEKYEAQQEVTQSIQKVIAEKPHSVEISVNAKGQYSGKVKVYAGTIDEAMKLSLLKAKELEIIISQKNN